MRVSPERVKRLREMKAWTQAELAAAASTSGFTIQRVESGERGGNVRPQTGRRIAEALGVQPVEIMQPDEDAMPEVLREAESMAAALERAVSWVDGLDDPAQQARSAWQHGLVALRTLSTVIEAMGRGEIKPYEAEGILIRLSKVGKQHAERARDDSGQMPEEIRGLLGEANVAS